MYFVDMKEARHILADILSERAASNASYSLRAFARDLEVSPQQLSNVMTGRRGLSLPVAQSLALKLGLNEHQKTIFLESLKARFSRSKTERLVSRARLDSLAGDYSSRSLELDLFKTISNWHHFALVQLVKLKRNNSQSIAWFAERLGVSENEISLALTRLAKLELVTKTQKGWTATAGVLIADRGTPTEAIRNFHRQLLEKAIQALAFQTQEERYGSSSVFPIKVSDVGAAKKLIQDFRIEFDRLISDSANGEEIYGLAIQFFRLTQTQKKKDKIFMQEGMES